MKDKPNFPEEDNKEEFSKYNEASLQILRLHELWLSAEFYARRSMLNPWKYVLDSIWRELNSDVVKMKKPTNVLNKNDKHMEKIAKSKTKDQKYFVLNNRHIFLKLLQDEVGKGSKYQDADTESFE